MKKMQCNAIDITTVTKQVWFLLYSRNYAAGLWGNNHESSDCFQYQKISHLNQAT